MRLEILEKDYYYHIYNRGINSEKIFNRSENKQYFLKLLAKYLLNKVSVFAYCLMDNHFHLIVRIDDEKKVTQAFSNLFNAYAKAFNKETKRTGSLFEKHFKRIRILDEEYLRQLIIYTHLNPAHHLGVDYINFGFSSYQSILSNQTTNLKRAEVINLFDAVENFIYCHKYKKELSDNKFTFE